MRAVLNSLIASLISPLWYNWSPLIFKLTASKQTALSGPKNAAWSSALRALSRIRLFLKLIVGYEAIPMVTVSFRYIARFFWISLASLRQGSPFFSEIKHPNISQSSSPHIPFSILHIASMVLATPVSISAAWSLSITSSLWLKLSIRITIAPNFDEESSRAMEWSMKAFPARISGNSFDSLSRPTVNSFLSSLTFESVSQSRNSSVEVRQRNNSWRLCVIIRLFSTYCSEW